jgi:hypothetical protein
MALRENPNLSANELQRRLGARRRDVQRIHNALRRLNPELIPPPRGPGRTKRFPTAADAQPDIVASAGEDGE